MADPALYIRVAANIDELKRNLAEGSSGVEALTSSVGKIASKFEGEKLIQHAHNVTAAVTEIGGASRLTASEQERVNRVVTAALEKYAALGKEAPQALRDLAAATTPAEEKTSLLSSAAGKMFAAFTAANLVSQATSALWDWGKAAIASAGETLDLAGKTGLTTDTIQRMGYVAVQTGTTLEAFTNAAFMLGVKLADGKDSVRAAVEELGLSLDHLRQQSPDEQFNAITIALERMENPQERNRIAVELFGKAAKEILPAIAEGYHDIAKAATVAGAQQLKAVDLATDAWDGFKHMVGQVSVQLAGGLVIAIREAYNAFADLTHIEAAKAAWADLMTVVDTFIDRLPELPEVIDHVKMRMGLANDAAKAISMSWEEAERIAKDLTASALDLADAGQEVGVVWGGGMAEAIRNTNAQYEKAKDTQEAFRTEAVFTAETVAQATTENFAETAAAVAQYTEQMQASVTQLMQLSDAEIRQRYGDPESAKARLATIEEYYRMYPGARSGGSGATGVGQHDAAGYRDMLAMQREYEELKQYLARNGRADGGPVTGGTPYLVGERGPEMFIPQASGQIVPNHAVGGGLTVQTHVTVNGHVMGSKDELARVVGDAVMRSLRAGGVRFAGAGA